MNRVKDAFDAIRADDKLKASTLIYVLNELNRRKRKKLHKSPLHLKLKLAIAFAACVLFFLSVFPYRNYFTAMAFLDFDLNPSLELSVNSFGRIIGACAYNDEGDEILSVLNLNHKDYQQAMRLVLNESATRGYLQDEALLSVTVQTQSADKEAQMLSNLKSEVAEILAEHQASPQVEVFPVSADIQELAHTHHVSPAKYLAILELHKVDPTVLVDACRDHSISEIRGLAHEHHHGAAHETEETETDSASGDEIEQSNQTSGSQPDNTSTSEHHGCEGHNCGHD
jgi:hypothetical protein